MLLETHHHTHSCIHLYLYQIDKQIGRQAELSLNHNNLKYLKEKMWPYNCLKLIFLLICFLAILVTRCNISLPARIVSQELCEFTSFIFEEKSCQLHLVEFRNIPYCSMVIKCVIIYIYTYLYNIYNIKYMYNVCALPVFTHSTCYSSYVCSFCY